MRCWLGQKWQRCLEFLELFTLNLLVSWRRLREQIQVVIRYYPHTPFRRFHLAFLYAYLGKNPFRIYKKWALERGEKELYTYGETPLTTLERMARVAGIGPGDTVLEMGCGRGTCVFWLNTVVGCRAIGVDLVPDFIEKAQALKETFQLEEVEFRLENMLKTSLNGVTVVYFYGTSSSRPFIEAFIERVRSLPQGTRIITVSYPLNVYCGGEEVFKLTHQFSAPFTWGRAQVYVQRVCG